MDQPSLTAALADLNLPAVRYFNSLDSTNDEARRWIETGSPHCGIVIADEQTAGRGRLGRRWYTPPGTGLAFSLILHSPPFDPNNLSLLAGLGAVAVSNALDRVYAIPAQIKWPNDVLINQLKVAGVLAEALWNGHNLKAAMVGIGINIAPESINAVNLPQTELNFPATCVECALGHPIDRLEILHAVLDEFLETLPQLSGSGFIGKWETRLAFLQQWVELSVSPSGRSKLQATSGAGDAESILVGKVIGLAQDGSLKLVTQAGKIVAVAIGEIHLRPTRADMP